MMQRFGCALPSPELRWTAIWHFALAGSFPSDGAVIDIARIMIWFHTLA